MIAAVDKKDAPKLDDSYILKIDGKNREVFMSYGILTLLSDTVGGVDRMLMVAADTAVQDAFIKILLAPVDEKGRPDIENFSVYHLKVNLEDMIGLIEWASEHVSYFLLTLMERQLAIVDRQKPKLQGLLKKQEEVQSLLTSMNG